MFGVTASSRIGFQEIAMVGGGTPTWVSVFPIGDNIVEAPYPDPVSPPAASGFAYGVDFSPQGDALVVGFDSSPYLAAYSWRKGFSFKFSNPSTIPTSPSFFVRFSNSGNVVASGHSSSPFVYVYSWSKSGFGSKFSDPTLLSADYSGGVDFSPNDDFIAVADGIRRVNVYNWSANGFGTRMTPVLPSGYAGGNVTSFSPANNAIAIALNNSIYSNVSSDYPNVVAFHWSNGFGTKYANPVDVTSGDAYSVSFSPNADAIGVVQTGSPKLCVYAWSYANGFGSKFSNPIEVTEYDTALWVEWSKNGDKILYHKRGYDFFNVYEWNNGFGNKYYLNDTGDYRYPNYYFYSTLSAWKG